MTRSYLSAGPPPGSDAAAPGRPGSAGPVWPPAWPSLWPVVARHAGFVAVVDVLTLVGLVYAADPATQWWALLPPLLLLAGPLTRLAATRRRAVRATQDGRLDLRPDGLVLIRRRLGPGWRQFARLTSDGRIRYLP